jgi:hypothetical protein
MIEKIISQDSNEVHSVWIPDRRSMASFVVWKAFGIGRHAHWREGQITLGASSSADRAFFPEFPDYMDRASIPEWIDAVIDAIDTSLPPTTTISGSFDADSATMALEPPAYRIPQAPTVQDAATCLLAARLLLAAASELVPPTHLSMEELVEELSFASRIAALLCGDEGRRIALEAARSPDLCSIIPDTVGAEDMIIKEQADD